MNITSTCRCGAEFSIACNSNSSILIPAVYREWQEIHKDCKDKQFLRHIPFKYFLKAKARGK